jgi:hypothetical protein
VGIVFDGNDNFIHKITEKNYDGRWVVTQFTLQDRPAGLYTKEKTQVLDDQGVYALNENIEPTGNFTDYDRINKQQAELVQQRENEILKSLGYTDAFIASSPDEKLQRILTNKTPASRGPSGPRPPPGRHNPEEGGRRHKTKKSKRRQRKTRRRHK